MENKNISSAETKKLLKKKRIMKYFINAAAKILQEEGIENVTIRRVSDLAGYNSATLYNYFEDINELITLAGISCINEYESDLSKYINETMNPLEQYINIWQCFCIHAFQKPELYSLIFVKHYTSTANSINKYYYLFPEELKPLVHDANEFFREANSRKRDMVPLSKCVASGCFEENQIEEIADIAALTFGGLLNRVINNKADYGDSVETTKLQIRYLIRILKSYNPSIEEKIRSEYIIPLKNLIAPAEQS